MKTTKRPGPAPETTQEQAANEVLYRAIRSMRLADVLRLAA